MSLHDVGYLESIIGPCLGFRLLLIYQLRARTTVTIGPVKSGQSSHQMPREHAAASSIRGQFEKTKTITEPYCCNLEGRFNSDVMIDIFKSCCILGPRVHKASMMPGQIIVSCSVCKYDAWCSIGPTWHHLHSSDNVQVNVHHQRSDDMALSQVQCQGGVLW